MIRSIYVASYIVSYSILQYILVAGSNMTLNHLATPLSHWAERLDKNTYPVLCL